jgi:[ribosomal protein S18]-alanine N-acetyltransferase
MRSDRKKYDIYNPEILPATNEERIWAADLLSVSEPWTTLGISKEVCLKNCHDPEFVVYVAHINGTSAGFFILDPRGMAGSPYIKSIAVSSEYRNHRLGSTLLTFAEDVARKTSQHMFLCVSSFNINARRFYERLGYEGVGELKDYLIRGESEIIMHKKL